MTTFELVAAIATYLLLLVAVAWLGQKPGSKLRKLADTPFIICAICNCLLYVMDVLWQRW